MDLLIVLGIYFIYSQFAFDSTTVNKDALDKQFNYNLRVEAPKGDTVPVTVAITNQRNRSATTKLPNGLLVLLTDGVDEKFFSRVLIRSTSLTLNSGETRSWRLSPSLPDSVPSPLYVVVYVDEDRQLRARVPLE